VAEKRRIPLEEIVQDPKLKAVSLNGAGGRGDWENVRQYIGGANDIFTLWDGRVMDIVKSDNSMKERLTVTGVGYTDGILRVQTCRGLLGADRHMAPFLVDFSGAERHEDFSLTWQEEIEGERVLFDEHWFLVDESELNRLQLYGIFYSTDGCVKGNWEVTVRVE
ncbi:MAG: hypothetical protein IJ833_05830, partial [Lachnospiraceae bacterium]|nr:hypothetical protein [Lachnospiraceae bacterium]